uniref:RING-type domain-containing protein n=1 Tax=Alexandrium catenella TaxID=2925 RepID=A0A7S1KW10_ALECA|mmetsp:Transcript_101773/g.270771  ORF Transcript_101773/g.270771 Transcript_101773/m.270771 type:complete len:290 (+) Transcript_101773:132-1001(+)|eukprot:CAMPEP_0171164634 /NCGR_PEP_ID=MMETSP0790-20130122/5772_1 /TAXON_ID=2925 /ORGANISM="Alexandrium catenella, Strain OF101" /LENGTH=289 /DNA_ID=CAMNT_0011629401 /DNA_START=96 /DNA_END=965 /DNA_ORIENTATION=+
MVTHVEDFADPAGITDELVCSICTGVFFDPQVGRCGHRFCGFCIEQWLKRSTHCPLCRAELKAEDLAECAEIREQCDGLQMACSWRCGWQGRRDEVGEHMVNCPVGYFVDLTVQLDGPLGVCFEILDGVMLVGCLHEEGHASRYNQAHQGQEDRQIQINDQVLSVDGIRGDPPLLTYLLHRPKRKSITLRHPEELAINIAKRGKKLGIDLSWSKPNGILTVLGVKPGAIEENNSSALSPSKQLRKLDRIIEINGMGCVGRPDFVVPLLAGGEEFVIKFHRLRRNSVCSL